ncbi:hypothetical protein CRE_00722 [Caenorhabditis remanei]|uniref:ShKT domain-containing protein n=1 Tax=Caenorhabditis remanei TaxID=31234 RepID=E3LE02_CAERE|nr:hypothetical protein CRE_00722 [Caenorhabditis remanei]
MLVPILIIALFSSIVTTYTTKPPCCRDHLGSAACSKLMHQNTRLFAKRCNSDAEFRLIQCCSSCNTDGIGMAYDLIARSLVSEHCFDRYGPKFCDRLSPSPLFPSSLVIFQLFICRYVNKTDVFEPHNTWSCDGENPQIAFRTCRKSCGYCNFSVVQYTLDNALQVFFFIWHLQKENCLNFKACRVQPVAEEKRRWRLKFYSSTTTTSSPSPMEVINSTFQFWNHN